MAHKIPIVTLGEPAREPSFPTNVLGDGLTTVLCYDEASAFGSNALQVGNMVYLAGCIGIDDEGKVVAGTIRDRTKRALFNANRRLQAVGLDLSDVVSVTIYLSKYLQDFAHMNEAYIESFPKNTLMPVRTCVGVQDLPAGTDIELTCASRFAFSKGFKG